MNSAVLTPYDAEGHEHRIEIIWADGSRLGFVADQAGESSWFYASRTESASGRLPDDLRAAIVQAVEARRAAETDAGG